MPLPATRRRTRRSLVASATLIDPNKGETGARMSKPWQERALTYIDLVPELNYASRFYARMLKQLRIFPAKQNPDGKAEPISEGRPVEVLNRIQDPGGGRSGILGNYGRLMFITGEGMLFGRNLGDEDERWEFVWNDELKINEGEIIHTPVASGNPTTYRRPEQAVAYRFWVSHPRRSGEADSPMRSPVDGGLAEELVILTKAVRRTAVTRMVNGLLVLPIEIIPPPIDASPDEDPENDPFMSRVAEHWAGQIEDAGSAAAAAPFAFWAASEYLDKIRMVSMHDPQTDYMERELRKEAVERMARGFDFPPEVLLGLSDSNHWAARQILEDMWKSHGSNIAEQFCDDLNEAYLRPALKEEAFPGWNEIVIGYDASEIVVKPDRSEDADQAWDRGAIGYPAYRKAKNFAEEDAQTDEEHQEWAALKLREATYLPSDLVPPQRGPQPQDAQPQRDAAEGPANPGPDGTTEGIQAASLFPGAAALAVIRCRELAGSRLRTYKTNCPDCLEPADGKPNALVASLINPQDLKTLGAPDARRLVSGGSDNLRLLLESFGVADLTATMLCELVEQHAAKTLHQQQVPDLPPGLVAGLVSAKENGRAMVNP